MRKIVVGMAALLGAASLAVAAPPAAFRSGHIAAELSSAGPAFAAFALDSLGGGRFGPNPVLSNAVAGVTGLTLRAEGEGRFAYDLARPGGATATAWRVAFDERSIVLASDFVPGAAVPPFVLAIDQKANHATLLGRMQPGDRRMELPCVLHLPDLGSARITARPAGLKLDYDARRYVKPAFVRVEFPPADAERRSVEYRLEVAAIHPALPNIEGNPLYDGFRRDWLNIFQVNPRVQMLANNASSDPVAFTVFEYSALARRTPPLADGLTCLDLVRMTVDRYLAGAKGYGQVGYACEPTGADLIAWKTPWTSLDTLPSLLIAACDYAEGAPDLPWARARYDGLLAWARAMAEGDADGDGLLEYPGTGNYGDRPLANRRPSNWWDTINFGHRDAFANALAYRAFLMFGDLAKRVGREDDARTFAEKAARLRAAYAPAFLNPESGLLAGWKSADGRLHDYAFTFVQGVAVTHGLLDDPTANAVMDRLLAKMQSVGYTNFSLGLPGNLVPVRKGDYVFHETPPEVHGVPRLEDGSDGFQYYENGGATGCWAYYTIAALFRLGRAADARRILHPMLAGYAAGEFQGFGPNGMSRDWRDWKGGGHGYEGLLVDNYQALLAVPDDVKAGP